MDEALMVWIAAIESGFARDGEWIAWADAKITLLDEPPLWLLHICVEQTAKEALNFLYRARSVTQAVWDPLDGIRLRIGFLYLTQERDHTDLLDLLTKASELTDCDDFNAECRAFWTLGKEAAGRPLFVSCYRPLADRVAETFEPFSELARRKWSRLYDEE